MTHRSPTPSGTRGERVALDALWADPWPILRQLRDEEPVAWVPAAGRYLVTRYDDVSTVEQHPEIYSANEAESLLYRVMGHPFMRKDGDEHRSERRALDSPMKPNAINNTWMPVFERNTEDVLRGLEPRGQADLIVDFCGPLAARNLAHLLGFFADGDSRDPEHYDLRLQEWSQKMMDAVGNYADVPEVWAAADAVVAEIDEEIDRTIARVRISPDASVISAAIENEMPIDALRAAIKVIIGGGVNEPRDAMGTASYALLRDADLRARVVADPTLWRRVFEETVRWVAPISMYPKMVVQHTELGGVALMPGDKIGVCVGSANRDERVFEHPELFDIDREATAHHGFGAGAHFCAGAWIARASVGQLALPELFRRLPDLRIAPGAEPKAGGWVFRGMLTLPVEWTPVKEA